MDQAPAVVLDHHEHVQQSERGGDGKKEVAGNDSLSVKAQECRPAQVASRSAWRTSRQVLALDDHHAWHSPDMDEVDRLAAAVFDLLSRPTDVASLAAAAAHPEQAGELYLASRLLIDTDNPAERAYLDALASKTRGNLPA
jgi:hypothetical protein